ncbi:uncharacterized protein SOCE26_029940 [Sorangium cellulosum]|uniref:Uncharacterized protein n=1 Tax=Sorangium cellulosum TaxID=56 RepID=A0A2L0EQJ2_SORCE|nr:uncharacterized protein SOCE26_029940 [Sorangium cellulosum]
MPGSVIACYSGPEGTSGVGRCAAGAQTCRPDGSGYGPCTGEVIPAAEVCATPEDESCDGDPHCSRPAPWARGFGGTGTDIGRSITSDAMGNYYVTGSFEGTADFGAGPLTSAGGQDVFLLKLDPSGALLWSKRFGTPFNEIGWAVAVDGNGDVLFAGTYDGSWGGPTGLDFGGGAIGDPDGDQAIFVAKLDADGNHIWSGGFDLLVPYGEPVVWEMALDALGNAYIAIDVDDVTDAASVMKVDAAGHAVWLHRLDGYESYYADLALDSAGNVVTANIGHYYDVPSVFISKLSPAGDVLWKRYMFEGVASHVAVAVNLADEILVATSHGLDATLTKLDEGGEQVFSRPLYDGSHPVVDPSGNIFVRGNVFTMLDPDGTPRWSVRGPGVGAWDLAISPNGAVAVTGGMYGAVDFGTGPLAYTGGTDCFVALFNPPASSGSSGGGGGGSRVGGGEEPPWRFFAAR